MTFGFEVSTMRSISASRIAMRASWPRESKPGGSGHQLGSGLTVWKNGWSQILSASCG
ncbi:MAG: hypothetical protein GY774_08285 [Planctomycetes bacterium]|nr:hypothetical protein [Planctomycetota bacterium]